MEFVTCHLCGQLGHLAHYCPNNDCYEPSGAHAEWLALEEEKSDDEIVEDLHELIANRGWLSKVRSILRLCKQRAQLLELANAFLDTQGHSLLSLAIKLNLRNTIQMLWANGICCGIDRSNEDSYFILMKMCDACHNEQKYDWFIGKSAFAARLEREGGLIDATVRVSLMWNCSDDLDVHVICPSGEEIMFNHKNSACGGELDVDMNASEPLSRLPIENIVWAEDAPAGEYTVIVNNYRHRSSAREVPFVVEVAVQGKQPVRIDGIWHASEGIGNRAPVHQFSYDPADVVEEDAEDEQEEVHEKDLPIVQHMNKLAGTKGSADMLAQLVWLVLRQRDPALLDACLALGLHDCRHLNQDCSVSPQWCFLQAIWALNLGAAEQLLAVCGKAINVNHKYRWDVIPWDETVTQMCWRECHGNERRDRPWMKALAWLAGQGADFSQVKLNFHRWRKPWSMQESQIRTFDRLIWHLSDENGWRTESRSAAKYLARVVKQLVFWGVHIPEDLDPDFDGEIEWGVNGRRPAHATSFCYGNLDLDLVLAAVRAGRSTPREQLMTALCTISKVCPGLHGSVKCHILQFLYPQLGRGRLAYATLQKSEGGRVSGPENERVVCSEDSTPPRGYVCGRCRQAGHWRKFCPRARA
jgi:hypothetical protein